MKLYGSLTSPYVRKARVLIAEKDLPVELVVEDPWQEGTPITGWNPLGKVPVLEVGPGEYFFDSTVVTRYLDQMDGKSLEPKAGAAYWKSQWWQALGNGIIDAAVARVLETRRLPRTQWPDKMQREEQRIHRAIDAAEHACPGKRYLVGSAFSMADLVLGVALDYVDFRYPHDWRKRAPKVARWHEGIAKRRSFTATLPPVPVRQKKRRATGTTRPAEQPPAAAPAPDREGDAA